MSATYFGKYISLTYPELIRRGTTLSPVTQGAFSYTNSISSDEHTLIDGNGDTVPGIAIDTTGNSEGGILFKDTTNHPTYVFSIKSNIYGTTPTVGLDFLAHATGIPNLSKMFLTSSGKLYIGFGFSTNDIGLLYGGSQTTADLNIKTGIVLYGSGDIGQFFNDGTNINIRTGNGISGNGGSLVISTYNTSKHISLITYGATSDVRLTSASNVNLSAASDNNITSVDQTIITTSTGAIYSSGSITPKFKVDSNIHSGTHTSQIYAALNVNIFASGIYNPNVNTDVFGEDPSITINWIRVGNMIYCTGLFQIVGGGRVINLPIISAASINVFGVWTSYFAQRTGSTSSLQIDRICGVITAWNTVQAKCEPYTDLEDNDYLYLSFSYEIG